MPAEASGVSARRERLMTVGSVVAAFLASQHHALHMLLMAGAGSAEMSSMNAHPLLRRAMLVIALVMAGLTGYRLARHRPPFAQRLAGVVSIVLTLALLGWSIHQFGL